MANSGLFEALMNERENTFNFKVEYKILEITEQICKIMEEKEISRADFSRIMGKSKSAITKMLRGDTNFTLKRMIKIAMALDKDLCVSFTKPKNAYGFNAIKKSQQVEIPQNTDYINDARPSPDHKDLDDETIPKNEPIAA